MATVETRPPGARPRRRREVRPAGAAREWRLTAFTGVALLVLVTAHMIAHHFVVESIGGLRSYDQVLEYMSNPVIFTIESFFLLFVTAHAMLGVRGVLLDLDPGPVLRRWIDVGLLTVGLLTLGYGYYLIGALASRAA
jgi:succinate dehydrogenase / fumarate reductase, membrane anchor subunit